MTHRANIKYASKRLYFLNEERPVRFLSNTFLHDFRLEWVRSRLLMLNLHPDGTELVDFGRLAKALLLYRSLSILASWRDSDPALRLRNNLHHLLRLTIWIRVHDILVFWIVQNSQEVWRVLVVNWRFCLIVNRLSSALRWLITFDKLIHVLSSVQMRFLHHVKSLVLHRLLNR